MVKKKIFLLFALGVVMAMSYATSPFASSGMKEVAEDYVANKGVGLHALRSEGGEIGYSNTFVQYGMKDDQYILRFATAIKGNVDSLVYKRYAVSDAPEGSVQAKDVETPVSVIYKSIVTETGNAYYNGEEVVYEASEATEGWYWACYSITYTSNTFYDASISIKLIINGDTSLVETKTISLSELLNSTTYSLEVAIWGRWITESQFIELFDGFKEFGTENGLDVTRIHYTYYAGASTADPYFYIADFTGAVVANGGADIVFPCATNLTTQDGTQITQATIEELNITLNGKSDRCVARLTDTELSNAFFNYCLSNEAKAILDPTYHPPIDDDVDQTKVLVVSCWGRFMKKDKFNELVEDFKKYCDENNVDYIEIIGRYYQGAVQGVDPYYLIADFTKKVKEDGNADIILPCADNIKTNQNNITVEDELIPIDVYGQKDRRVASLNQDDLTKEFLSYIQTDSAKAILSKVD